MRFFYSFLLCFLFSVSAVAQINLVANPSFEDTTNYNNWYVTNGSLPWFNPTTATPDYFSIYPGYGYNISINPRGFQSPRTGNAFAGLFTF